MFSKFIGVSDVNSAELLAIKEVVAMFKDSVWSNSYHLMLETYSTICEQQLRNPNLVSVAFNDIVDDILNHYSGLIWEIKAVPGAANGIVDRLAKSGISRAMPFVWKTQC
ncbi:hypothetical protein V6N11_040015 [Hibiscus sabdariffa]|uniref:Uncharacterized protein n=1 Tax=Hibiscus sabdariffa TaxID=183260 RepID=A0ABR2RGI5_9ROSI